MLETCAICNKRRDEMALLNKVRFSGNEDSLTVEHLRVCLWCAEAEASARELYPDSDNLIGCPRCGNDMLRTQAVCHGCRQEINAHYG